MWGGALIVLLMEIFVMVGSCCLIDALDVDSWFLIVVVACVVVTPLAVCQSVA